MRGWSDASETPRLCSCSFCIGLEKAIHQIEQAIKRPKVDSSDDEAQRAISVLQESCAGGLMPLRLHAYAHAHSVLTGPEPDQGVPGGTPWSGSGPVNTE
jgi:hypothetical protein